jgi:DNA-binding MarR family transcriptional regulator
MAGEVFVPVTRNGEALGNVKLTIERGEVLYSFLNPNGKLIFPSTRFNPKAKKSRPELKKDLEFAFTELTAEECERYAIDVCIKAEELLSAPAPKQEKKEDVQQKEPEINREAALEVLKDPNLLKRVFDLLERQGYRRDYIAKAMNLYTCLSAYTEEPQNLFLKGPSSSGKSFGATQVAKLFPKENVWLIGRMSPTALIHSRGEYDEENNRIVIDLTGKILVFLENVREETLEMLLPILSHDSEEIEYKITDKGSKGNHKVKNVIIRGFPATIFCTSRLKLVEDLKTRSLLVTPEISEEKTKLANIAYARRFSTIPNGELDQEERKIREAFKLLAHERGRVIIPFAEKLAEAYPPESHEEMRNFKKYLSLIYLNAFLHKYQRPKVEIEGREYIVATEEDYIIATAIFNKIAPATKSGIPEHVNEFYEKVLMAIHDDSERYSRNILKKHREVFKRPIGYSTYREYERMLEDVGWIFKDDHPEDKRKKIIILNRENNEKLLQHAPSDFNEIFTEKDFENWLNTLPKNCCYFDLTYSHIKCENTKPFQQQYFEIPVKQNEDEKKENDKENSHGANGSKNPEPTDEEREKFLNIIRRYFDVRPGANVTVRYSEIMRCCQEYGIRNSVIDALINENGGIFEEEIGSDTFVTFDYREGGKR